jgi:hypothetical protein
MTFSPQNPCDDPNHPFGVHECEHVRHRPRWAYGMAFASLLVALWCIGLIWASSRAGASEPPVVLNSHRVVVSSVLPPCGTPPCSYNFGVHTGNYTALAWWQGTDGAKHYVWGRTPPAVLSGWAHWATRHDRRAIGVGRGCWVHESPVTNTRYKCPSAGQPR